METKINILEDIGAENPILIEGLPGIGNVGRIAAEYFIKKLDAKKFAELYSPHFMPIVLIHNDEVSLLKCEFYYWKNNKGNDLIFLTGDTQAGEGSTEGHFEVAEKVVNFAKELGVERMYTLGGFSTGKVEKEIEGEPEVLGAATDKEIIDEFSDIDVNFEDAGSKIGMIVGATGVLLGLGRNQGISGVCLMGETAGFPILTDPKAAEGVVKVLSEMLEVEIELEDMEKKVNEMEEFIKKLEKVQKKAMKKAEGAEGGKEKLRYIG